MVDVEGDYFVDFRVIQDFHSFFGDLATGLNVDFAGFRIYQVDGHVATNQIFRRHQLFLQPFLFQVAYHPRRHLGADLGGDAVGFGVYQVYDKLHAPEAVDNKFGFPSFLFHPYEGDFFIKVIEDILGCHAGGFIRGHGFAHAGALGPELFRFLVIQSYQERRHRQLAAAVDAHEHQVLGVEFEVEPRTAVGNDARREQEFARRMGLALVVVEKHPRRTVHLGNDDPLRAIDDEGAVVGHQWHITHENVLFLDVADGA